MRIHNYLNRQVLKIIMSVGVLCFSFSVIYSQETKQDAILSFSFQEDNDRKILITKAIDSFGLPIEDLELFFYVRRTFSLLPIGDPFNATDENGIIELEFPNNLPGNSEGNLIIVTKIMESDIYNDLTIETTKNWGTPVFQDDTKVEKRSLWAAAANAPMSLIAIVSLLILSVWYVICYIIYKLYKISKIKPLNN